MRLHSTTTSLALLLALLQNSNGANLFTKLTNSVAKSSSFASFETDIEFVQKHLKGVDKEEFDLVRAFVQQGGSNEFGGESNIINDDEDSLLENDVSSAEDGARYLQGFYRIGDVPKDIGSDSHFEQILYPERYAESSDGDMIMSPKLSHGIPDDNFKIPDYVAFVHTHGKKTRLTHLFRDDDRGLLLNALRRMRIVNKD